MQQYSTCSTTRAAPFIELGLAAARAGRAATRPVYAAIFVMGVAITMAGYSESRAMVNTMQQILDCDGDIPKDADCWRENATTTFFALCRNNMPISRHGCVNGNSMAYVWESFAGIDKRLETLLSATQRGTESRRVLVYAVGTHYFAQFPYHGVDHYFNHHHVEYPQAWLTQYYRDMQLLMHWLSRWQKRNICVVWKTNNIGFSPQRTYHPSQSHGAHYFLNRWNVAMAEAARLLVFDVEPLTMRYSKHHWNHSTPNSNDFYHDYDWTRMSLALISFIHINCNVTL